MINELQVPILHRHFGQWSIITSFVILTTCDMASITNVSMLVAIERFPLMPFQFLSDFLSNNTTIAMPTTLLEIKVAVRPLIKGKMGKKANLSPSATTSSLSIWCLRSLSCT